MFRRVIVFLSIYAGIGIGFSAKAANIVTNPGFETGDFSGWTLSGTDSSPSDNGIFYGVDSLDAHSGSFGAYFGPVGGVLNLTQALTTDPGTTYTVMFWLAESPDTPAPYVNSFTASLGGTTLVNMSNTNGGNYTQYTATATVTSAASILAFAFRDDTGFFSLDDISVSPGTTVVTPEPTTSMLMISALAVLITGRRKK